MKIAAVLLGVAALGLIIAAAWTHAWIYVASGSMNLITAVLVFSAPNQ